MTTTPVLIQSPFIGHTPPPTRHDEPPAPETAAPIDHVSVAAAAAPEAAPRPQHGFGHHAGTALMVAVSLAGVVGTIAPAFAVEATPQTSISTTVSVEGPILQELQGKGELYSVKRENDSDRFGKRLTADQALEKLQKGEGVIVRARIGSPGFKSRTAPETALGAPEFDAPSPRREPRDGDREA